MTGSALVVLWTVVTAGLGATGLVRSLRSSDRTTAEYSAYGWFALLGASMFVNGIVANTVEDQQPGPPYPLGTSGYAALCLFLQVLSAVPLLIAYGMAGKARATAHNRGTQIEGAPAHAGQLESNPSIVPIEGGSALSGCALGAGILLGLGIIGSFLLLACLAIPPGGR